MRGATRKINGLAGCARASLPVRHRFGLRPDLHAPALPYKPAVSRQRGPVAFTTASGPRKRGKKGATFQHLRALDREGLIVAAPGAQQAALRCDVRLQPGNLPPAGGMRRAPAAAATGHASCR